MRTKSFPCLAIAFRLPSRATFQVTPHSLFWLQILVKDLSRYFLTPASDYLLISGRRDNTRLVFDNSVSPMTTGVPRDSQTRGWQVCVKGCSYEDFRAAGAHTCSGGRHTLPPGRGAHTHPPVAHTLLPDARTLPCVAYEAPSSHTKHPAHIRATPAHKPARGGGTYDPLSHM